MRGFIASNKQKTVADSLLPGKLAVKSGAVPSNNQYNTTELLVIKFLHTNSTVPKSTKNATLF